MNVLKPNIAAAIIAGGKSSRFGSGNKALSTLGDKTVIEHIYERMLPQAEAIWLNTPDDFVAPKSLLGSSGTNQVSDPDDSQAGPLSGVLAVMEKTVSNYEWLLICPCDTPFIPRDLSSVLFDTCSEQKCDLAIAESNGRYHPSISLWNRRLFEKLQSAVYKQKKAGFKQFYPETKHCFVSWPVHEYDPFFNINYSEDLQTANTLFDKLRP